MKKITRGGWGVVMALALFVCGKLEANGSTNVLSVCDEPSLRAAVAQGGWVSITCNGTVTLTNTIYITNNVVLDASGVSFGISGGNAVQIFNVTNGASLGGTNLTLANGSCLVVTNDVTTNADGGAIYNYGTVSLMCCTLSSNSAQALITGGTGRGGAIFNNGGSVTLSQSRIVNSLAVGGGLKCPLFPTNDYHPTVMDAALGGAIYNAGGTLTITGCTLSSNLCENVVEYIFNCYAFGMAMGGAVFQTDGSTGITNSSFAMNQAMGGNGIDFQYTRPSPAYGGALAVTSGSLSIDHSQFGMNSASGGGATDGTIAFAGTGGDADGGAVYCLSEATFSDSSFFGNQAAAGYGDGKAGSSSGGGIYNGGGLELIRCAVYANSAVGGAGAVYNGGESSAGGDALGGGIYNDAELDATNCTIALNSSTAGSGSVYAVSEFPPPTQYSYGANGNAEGGGAYNIGAIVMMNVTAASNNCVSQGMNPTNGLVAGVQVANGGTLSLRNSILAYGGTNSNVGGAITDGGYNICSDGSANLTGPGSLNNTDPLLETLSNYGGPTWCMALSNNSPAIGAGGSAGAPATDQRGAARTGAVDIGAYQSGVYTNLSNQVNVADEAHLRAAIANGGWVRILCNGTVTLSNTISVYNNLVLDASGVSFGISGGNAVRLFTVACGGSLTLTNLTLANGSFVLTNNSVTTNADGGAIYNSGTVTLSGCTLSSNSAQALIYGGTARGGAIFNDGGSVTLLESSVINSVALGGGPNSPTPPYTNYPPSGAPTIIDISQGGAIYNDGGTINLTGCNVSGSLCHDVMERDWNNFGYGWAMGGAVYQSAGVLIITNSEFETNQVIGDKGPDDGTGGASPAYGGALVIMSGTLSIEHSGFEANLALGGNAGDATIQGAGPGGLAYGGAVYSLGTGVVADSTFVDNLAAAGSGAGYYGPGELNGFGCGGAIYTAGTIELDRCSIYFNAARGSVGIPFNGGTPSNGGYGLGGGIYNAGLASITNCTVALNLAVAGTGSELGQGHTAVPGQNGDALGAGIFNSSGVSVLMNDTVATNTCTAYGPGLYGTNGFAAGMQIGNTNGTFSLHNTIIAYGGTNGNAYGPITDIGHNISSDNSAGLSGPGSLNNTDPLLGPLANYGGPTWCMALRYNSPAINAGDSAGAPATDQRGDARPNGAGVDIGAYEFYSDQIDVPHLALLSEVINSGTNTTLSFTAYPSGRYYLQTSSNLVSWITLTPSYGPYNSVSNVTLAVPNVYARYGFFRLMLP